MKSFLFFSLMVFTSLTWAAQGWKVVAVTTNNCQEKVEVLAKEGEKFVYVNNGSVKTKLVAEDGSAFSEESGKLVTFSNADDKSSLEKYTFIQPSMVDPNPAKIQIASNGLKANCKMKLK
jgi:hypothetical protein